MDFTLDDDQRELAELAARICSDKVTEQRLRSLDASDSVFDDVAWQALCDAGLVSMCLAEADGGGAMTILEACLVAEEVGRRVAPVPYVPAVVSAMAVSRFGTAAQRARWCDPLGAGETLAVPALAEPGRPNVTARPDLVAVRSGDADAGAGDKEGEAAVDGAAGGGSGGWLLSGTKVFVTWAPQADVFLVPATDEDGVVGVFLVDARAAGVELEVEQTTSGLPEAQVHLNGARVDGSRRLGGDDDGSAIVSWLVDHLTVGICALQSGVSAEALRLTAEYTSQRAQFNAPIATFQAVAQRAADAYIDAQGVRFTMLQAAWRMSMGMTAADEIDIATFWAGDGGQRVAHAAQHLHGGIGVDTDYPLHRYFLWAKHLELSMGGSTLHLARMGRRLAEVSA